VWKVAEHGDQIYGSSFFGRKPFLFFHASDLPPGHLLFCLFSLFSQFVNLSVFEKAKGERKRRKNLCD
jgi:hypothetical protein